MKKDQIKFNIFFALMILLFLSFQARDVFAETTVGGNITADTTWTKANSPYIVTSTVQVLQGVKLTIEPGVTIKFNAGAGLTIGGELDAVGTENEMIVFTSNQTIPQPKDWIGIKFTNSAIDAQVDNQYNYVVGSIIKYCVVEYAGDSAIDLDYASPYISNNIIKNNYSDSGGGVYVYQSSPVIKNNLFTNEVIAKRFVMPECSYRASMISSS